MGAMLPYKKHTRGSTIVELLIAVAILTFGALGVYEHFLALNQRGRDQLGAIQARCLALGELEQLRACSYEELKQWKSPATPASYPNHLKFICQDSVSVRPDGLLELTVQMGWDMPRGGKFEAGRAITVKGLKGP